MPTHRAAGLRAFLLPVGLLASVSCMDRDAKAELAQMRAQRVLQQENETLVETFIAGLNAQDTTAYAVYAPDAKIYLPSASAKAVSPAEDLQATKQNWQGFPDLHFTVEEMVAEGNKLAVRLHVTGTHTNAWNGIPATGKRVDIGSVMIVRVEHGKITEQYEDADFLGLFTQMGLELRPGKGR